MQSIGMATPRFGRDFVGGGPTRQDDFAYYLQSGGKIEIDLPTRDYGSLFDGAMASMYPQLEALLQRYAPGAEVTLTSPQLGMQPAFSIEA